MKVAIKYTLKTPEGQTTVIGTETKLYAGFRILCETDQDQKKLIDFGYQALNKNEILIRYENEDLILKRESVFIK